jgi:hypothetical protein
LKLAVVKIISTLFLAARTAISGSGHRQGDTPRAAIDPAPRRLASAKVVGGTGFEPVTPAV